jgi:hypothetical protein
MLHRCSVRSRRTPAPLVVTLISTVAACSDSTAPPNHPEFEPAASVRWNAIARDLVIKYRTDPPLASRTYALLSVAQDRAVRAVAGTGGMPKPLDHAAVVGASVAILTAAYPAESAVLDSTARGERERQRAPGRVGRTRGCTNADERALNRWHSGIVVRVAADRTGDVVQ